jgi:hypothetical protein
MLQLKSFDVIEAMWQIAIMNFHWINSWHINFGGYGRQDHLTK